MRIKPILFSAFLLIAACGSHKKGEGDASVAATTTDAAGVGTTGSTASVAAGASVGGGAKNAATTASAMASTSATVKVKGPPPVPLKPAVIDPGPPRSNGKTIVCASEAQCPKGVSSDPQEQCKDHKCVCNAAQGAGRCPSTFYCIDQWNDLDNCGKCGNKCAPGLGCKKGNCVSVTCAAGQTNCDGTCSDLRSDDFNCGKCFHPCPGKLTCVNGHCEF